MFEVTSNDLKCEITVLKSMIKFIPNYLTIKGNITKNKFTKLFKIIQLAITLPVSSVTCERKFLRLEELIIISNLI